MLPIDPLPNSKLELWSAKCDLVKSFRVLLIFGRIIGVVPYSGVTIGKVEQLKFRWKSFGAITNCVICVFMTLNIVAGAIGFFKSSERGAQEMAGNMMYPLLYIAALCNYLFFLVKAEDFLRILKEWKVLDLHCPVDDRNLWRDVTLVVVSTYTSIILENVSWHIKHALAVGEIIAKSSNGSTKTSLEYFYKRAWPRVASVIPYHPFVISCIFITNKLCLYSREFGDILIVVISRAIYVKFKLCIERANEKLICKGIPERDPEKWKYFIRDFYQLLDILTKFEKFLSPLVFLSYSISIYYISLRLCVTLQIHENLTIIDSLYANWSFLHGIIRTYLVSLSAAKINEHVLSVRYLFAKCPQEIYSPQVERLENQLNNSYIGLNGFGCFTVTEPFMPKLIGVIFTVEIVLLQSTVK